MKLTPGQSLVLLLLIGGGVSGWLYGVHWKKIANGDGFSQEEKLIIQLQDQIRTLSDQNAQLIGKLHDLQADEPEESPAAQ
jgi:hypothetical protein